MSTNYYIACKTCKHDKIHLGKVTSWKAPNINNNKLTFISNYNLFGIEELIKNKRKDEILIDEYDEEITNQEFMIKVRACDLHLETTKGEWC